VEDNPVNLVDPTGESALKIIKEIFKKFFNKPPKKPSKPPKEPGKGKNSKPTCTLIRSAPPGSYFNKGCSKCWACYYQCKGSGIVGGGQFITRYQIGGCVNLKGPGYVPGFHSASACEAAASAGETNNPTEGLYPGDEL
jgi:hypothetical protein